MNKVFALENEKSWKTVFVTADALQLITKSYSAPEDFVKGYSDESLGRLLKQKSEIFIPNITALSHAEKEPKELIITADGKKTTLDFKRTEDLQEVTAFLSSSRKFAAE